MFTPNIFLFLFMLHYPLFSVLHSLLREYVCSMHTFLLRFEGLF